MKKCIITAYIPMVLFFMPNYLEGQSNYALMGTDFSFKSITRNEFRDISVDGSKILALSFTPKVLIKLKKSFWIGACFNYVQVKETIKDSFLIPVRRGYGVILRKEYLISKRRNVFLYLEGRFLMNNFSPQSKKNTDALYNAQPIYPRLSFSYTFSKKLYGGLYFNLGVEQSYFPKTNKLFISPDGFCALEYKFGKAP
jgi:hypothetical protein